MIGSLNTKFGAVAGILQVGSNVSAFVFNQGIAFEIPGGATGIELSHIHVGMVLGEMSEPPSIRLIVARGKVPDDITPFQQCDVDFLSDTGIAVPSDGIVGLPLEVLYSKVWSEIHVGEENALPVDNCNFPRGGPRVGANEYMAIMLFPIFVDGAGSEVDANSRVFLQMNAWGFNLPDSARELRSIPPSRIGGL